MKLIKVPQIFIIHMYIMYPNAPFDVNLIIIVNQIFLSKLKLEITKYSSFLF